MKNVFYLFVILSVLLSCKSNIKQQGMDSAAVPEVSKTLIHKFRPILQGIWVKSDYITDILKTKSPHDSNSKLNDVASILINTEELKGDTLMAGVSVNNHEGADFIIYFRAGQNANSLKINWKDYDLKSNFYELGYEITGKDTTLILYHCDKNNRVLDRSNYYRVAKKALDSSDGGWGIDYITNKSIFTGSYFITGIMGANSRIEFTNEGKVSGFLNYKTYSISTDFEVMLENNLDQIYLGTGNKKGVSYVYKFNADTLNLYEELENADSTALVVGKLKYRLVKQK